MQVVITTKVEIELNIETAAKWFSGLSDDEMCQFLVIVADEMERCGPDNRDRMWWALGGHLRNCKCSTENAREMIRSWAHYLEASIHS